jgi:ppGpp synthetase/RelA/SpoT-type nucleotidyltranferase
MRRSASSPWNRLWIEIQLRTSLQHAWATAVETVDAFTNENLKFGAGSDD